MRSIYHLAAWFCVLVMSTVHAAGDVDSGAQKVQTCAACHGPDGNSADPQYPSLAGQVPGYIAAQLAAFKSGVRDNPIMMGMVQPLSEQDMADIDAYYANRPVARRGIAQHELELASAGETVYRGGYQPLSVAPCIGCHGPTGHGIPPRFPRVSGQYPQYLEQQLLAFKSGARESEVMQPIAFRLSEQQIRNLSLYMSALE